MPQKIDQGAMAQAAHDKQVEARKDGGPGSGPHQGGTSEINRRKSNVEHYKQTKQAVKEGKNVSEEDLKGGDFKKHLLHKEEQWKNTSLN